MGIIQNLVTLCGVFGIIALLLVLFCRRFPGWNINWTMMTNYLFGSTKEEKMVLTKPGTYNQNGCMIPSSDSSEFALSGRGSFRHFDKTDQDYTLLRQTSNSSLGSNSSPRNIAIGSANIPPQPLRPAPIPPYIVGVVGSLQSQNSLDSVFTTAPNSPGITIPHPSGQPSATTTTPGVGGSGDGSGSSSSNFSNNNPFLPLIQASTQFFTQKFQSFQQQSSFYSNGNGSNGPRTSAPTMSTKANPRFIRHSSESGSGRIPSAESPHIHEEGKESTVSSSEVSRPIPSSKPGGMSMGEILFSSPPAHSLFQEQFQHESQAPQEKEQGESGNSYTTSSPPAPQWTNENSNKGVVARGIMGSDNILGEISQEKDTKPETSLNIDIGESDTKRENDMGQLSRESKQNSVPLLVNQDATTFSTSGLDGSEQSRAHNNNSHIVTNLSTKPSSTTTTTTPVSISENIKGTLVNPRTELQHSPQQNSRSPSPSPTRIRDRQRKMELTLQHIQNNQEERMKNSSNSSSNVSHVQVKKHHNLDSHYPISTPYVPKLSDPMGGGGDSSSKSLRYRSPHHRPLVPPLKEADELALTDVSPPPQPPPHSSGAGGGGGDSFSFSEIPTQLQPTMTKSFHRSSLDSSCCDDVTCNKWILESMREEIRLENERMEDATKSLMMDEEFSIMALAEKKRKDGNEVGGGGGLKEKEKSGGESRPILKSLPLTSTTSGSYSSSQSLAKRHDHHLEKSNNPETSEPGLDRIGTLGKSSSKDNNKGISHANYNGGLNSEQNSEIKSNLIPTEINPTGTGDVGSTISHPTSASLDMERLQNRQSVREKATFSSNNGGGGSNGGYSNGSGSSSSSGYSSRPLLVERAQSYSSPSSSGGGVGQLVGPPFRNTRSFSLRQSSTDSIGSEPGSDGSGSPDGGTFLPALQRALSCDSVSSDTSVVLGDLDPPHPTGFLCVGLEYDGETADLLVNVMEGKELVGPDPSSMAAFDSYVRVYLLPDKTTNMQTRVCRKSLNPVYREKFMFGVETIELPLRTLVFYLYATDKYSNTLVGETEVKLGDLDIYQPITTWLQLTDTGQKGGESGEIMFSLSYLPTAERLTVVVVKARNLKFPHERETGDPFVKVYLLQKGKKVSKKKSSTKRGEKNPIFNEAMIFNVPVYALQTIQLRITVADTSEIEGRANSIGHVIVGSQTAGKPLSHWNQMISSLRKPIAMWHPLFK